MPRARRLLRGVVGWPPRLKHTLRLATTRRSAPYQRWCVAPFAKAPADRDGRAPSVLRPCSPRRPAPRDTCWSRLTLVFIVRRRETGESNGRVGARRG